MSGDGSKKELNNFEKDMEDLKEWQDNQFNPGYYIGTGRVPRPISSLSKYPKLLIIFGVVMIISGISFLILAGATWSSIISGILPLLLGGAFLYGGIQRIIVKRKK